MFHVGSAAPGTSMSKKRAKPQKAEPTTWFATLYAAQLRELCAACKLPSSGLKPDLIARLVASPCAEFSSIPGTGHNLLETCAAAGLSSEGEHFDLVVRIMRHRSGPDAEPLTKKRRKSREVPADKILPKDVSVSPELDTITMRAAGWCMVDKTKWSDKRWKTHAIEVFQKADAFLKTNTSRGPTHGLAVARALFRGIAAGADEVVGWRYAEYEMGEFTDEYIKLMEASVLTKNEVSCRQVEAVLALCTAHPVYGVAAGRPGHVSVREGSSHVRRHGWHRPAGRIRRGAPRGSRACGAPQRRLSTARPRICPS